MSIDSIERRCDVGIINNKGKVTGILMLVIGIILLIWPGTTLIAFCRLLGWCLVIAGAIEIIMGLIGSRDAAEAAGGAVTALIGIVFIARPGLVISFLPVLVGVCIAVVGALYLIRALLRRESGPGAVFAIAGGAAALIVGLILAFHPFSAVRLMMIVLGILLVYFGILRIGRS